MRFLAVVFFSCLAVPAWAEEPTPKLHDAIADCIAAALTPDAPEFPKSSLANGDPFSGYVVWYDLVDGTTVYGTRFATEDGVSICSGPAPMGPFLDDYDARDKAMVTQMMKDSGLNFISVPLEGDYYADCAAETPKYFMAVQVDEKQKVGFKFIRSHNVPETCRKFGS